jgi:hypothetical protein
MEKKCFIIMPGSDPDGYASGHVNRVYDYIIVPACRAAGFWPERADNPNTSTSALDTIKNMIDSDIAICDLSANNANALYVLATRQALDLPVTVIKDLKTQLKFFSQELSLVEYDDSLRIDTVQKEVEILRQALEKTFANKAMVHGLLSRLGIGPGQIVETPSVGTVDEPTAQAEPVAPKEKHLPVISPLPDYVGEPINELEIEKIKVGNFLFHMNYGKGEVKTVRKVGKDKMAEVLFESGSKTLILGTSGILRQINA